MPSQMADKQAKKQVCLPRKQHVQTYKGRFDLLLKKTTCTT